MTGYSSPLEFNLQLRKGTCDVRREKGAACSSLLTPPILQDGTTDPKKQNKQGKAKTKKQPGSERLQSL